MEHDIDKLIRQKISIVEHQPIAWRKESVWNKVSEHLEPSRKKVLVYYYAAACVVLLIASFVYLSSGGLHKNSPEKKQAEAIVSDKSTSDSAVTTASAVAKSTEKKSSTEFIARQSSHMIDTTMKTVAIPQKDNPPEEIKVVEDVVTPVIIFDSSRNLNIARNKKKIAPIIGVYSGDEKQESFTQTKKKKFPWLRTETREETGIEKPSDQSILARIN
jgi:hypothetical protein